MSNKYEQLVEFIINDETDKARELFHKIVVEKSRDIYESLVEEEDLDEVMGGNEVEEMVKDVQMDEEGISEEEEYGEEGEESEEDEDGAFDHDEMGGEEQDVETRVDDLESALDELKAEFDSLMADEANEPEHNDGVDDPDFGGEDDFGGEEEPAFGDEEGSDEFGGEEEEMEGAKEIHHYHHDGDKMPQDEFQAFMEYVHKVALPKHGDNGVNTKSVVDNMKNDMGGTNANILNGGTSTSGGTKGGLLTPSTDDLTKGLGTIQNRPDSKAGKTAFTKREPGHGPEKKGSGEKADNTKSMIGKRVR